jgi:hypothetical protein
MIATRSPLLFIESVELTTWKSPDCSGILILQKTDTELSGPTIYGVEMRGNAEEV